MLEMFGEQFETTEKEKGKGSGENICRIEVEATFSGAMDGKFVEEQVRKRRGGGSKGVTRG